MLDISVLSTNGRFPLWDSVGLKHVSTKYIATEMKAMWQAPNHLDPVVLFLWQGAQRMESNRKFCQKESQVIDMSEETAHLTNFFRVQAKTW